MDPPGTDRTTFIEKSITKEREALMEAKSEETLEPPEGKILKKSVMQEHKDNDNYESLSYVYLVAKGQCDLGNLNVNDIKEKKTFFGNTALHLAARHGINEVVKKIAESDKELFSSVNSNLDRPYHVAARAGHVCTLHTLLAVYAQYFHNIGRDERGCREMLLTPNKHGNNIFHEALINGGKRGSVIFEALALPVSITDREGAVKSFSLLESDVYGDEVAFSVNGEGKTPLYLAIQFGYKPIVERLFKNCKGNPEGKSPILAAIVKRDSAMLDIILRNKPEWIHLKDAQGWLPIHYAAYFGHHHGVSRILKMCSSCNLIKLNKDGSFPLHLASYGGHLRAFKELLKHSLDPCDMVNNKGQNVLHIAAKKGRHNVVSHILQVHEHADIMNEKDKDGNTPLHLAARFFHARVVQTLTWDERVKLTMFNNEKQTALDVAEYAMHENPTLRERLTWSALASAKTPRGPKFPNKDSSRTEFENTSPEDEISDKSLAENTSVNKNTTVPDKIASLSSGNVEISRGLFSTLAEEFLKEKSQNQRPNTEIFKDRIDTLILVATLIVTVTFAAGIQFPGGSNDNGQAKLLHRRIFQLYVISITISMYGGLVATTILFLARLGSITLLDLALNFAMPLLGITLATLSVAFLAAVYLIISKLTWLVIVFLLIGIIFIFLNMTVYILLFLPSPSILPICRYISYYPFLLLAWLDERKKVTQNKN